MNNLTTTEIKELIEKTIDLYLNNYKEEILFKAEAIKFHIPDADADTIIDVVFDTTCKELENYLKKIFDTSLIEGNEIIDILVMEYLEELFKTN